MAPETRSIAAKRNKLCIADDSGEDEKLNKRQKRLQSLEGQSFPSKSRYNSRFISGEIVPGRFVDLNFFNAEGFQFGKWFKDLNWISVVGIKHKFYPDLVRHFYANLSYDPNKTQILSLVKGKEIRLDQDSLEKIFGIPNLGIQIYDMKNNWVDEDVGVNRLEALRLIFDVPDLSEVSKVNSSHLKLEMRLLHQMIVHILLPRERSFNSVSDLDLLVMWHIVKKKPFNLPFVLLSHIISCSESKNAYFPYGMILTAIFEHYNVSLDEEESKELNGCSVYNEGTLHKMGYVKTEFGWCLKKDKAVVQASSKTQLIANSNVSESQDGPIASPDSKSHQTTEDGDKILMPVPNTSSPSAQHPHSVFADGNPLSTHGDKQASLIAGIHVVLEGMREDKRGLSMDTEQLRNQVTQLGLQMQRRTIGGIFLLLEIIMGDMRTSRSKIDTLGSNVDILLSQLTELLRLKEDWDQEDKESMERTISETSDLKFEIRNIIRMYESISSGIQDIWDMLSSRM